MNKCSF